MSNDIHRRMVVVDDDGLCVIPPPPHIPECKSAGTSRYNEECDGCLYDYYALKIRELISYTLSSDTPKSEGRKHGGK